jgi:hypothetical protein
MREEAKAKRDEEDRQRELREEQQEEALRQARRRHEQSEARRLQQERDAADRVRRQIQEGRNQEEMERERQRAAQLAAEERRRIEAESEREHAAQLERERQNRLEAEQRRLRDLDAQIQADRDREELAKLEIARKNRLEAERRRLQDLDERIHRRQLARESIPPRAPSPARPSPTYAPHRRSVDLQDTLHKYEYLEAQLHQRLLDSDPRSTEHDLDYQDRRSTRDRHPLPQDRIDGPRFGLRRNITNTAGGSNSSRAGGSAYSSPQPSPSIRSPAHPSPALGSLGRGEYQHPHSHQQLQQQLTSQLATPFDDVEYRRMRGEVVLEQERQTAAEEEDVWDEDEEHPHQYQVPALTRRNTIGGAGRARETRYRGLRRRYPD